MHNAIIYFLLKKRDGPRQEVAQGWVPSLTLSMTDVKLRMSEGTGTGGMKLLPAHNRR